MLGFKPQTEDVPAKKINDLRLRKDHQLCNRNEGKPNPGFADTP
jgi:hypothetical protein